MSDNDNGAEYARITRDGALLWLNDRLGKSVSVAVMINRDDGNEPSLFWTSGVLRHWSADAHDAWRTPEREDIQGLYVVNEATAFDLSHVERDLEIRADGDYHALRVGLGEDAYLEIVERPGKA